MIVQNDNFLSFWPSIGKIEKPISIKVSDLDKGHRWRLTEDSLALTGRKTVHLLSVECLLYVNFEIRLYTIGSCQQEIRLTITVKVNERA